MAGFTFGAPFFGLPLGAARRTLFEVALSVHLAAAGVAGGDAGAVCVPAGAGRGAGGVPILTHRELAVLELLANGHTNREIAAALYISPSTAGVHVSNILRKLGAKRRVDAAGLAHKMGLLPVA